MSQFQEQLENIPGYGIVMDKFNDYAEDHWNNTDPYTDKTTGKKLKPTRYYYKAGTKSVGQDPIYGLDP